MKQKVIDILNDRSCEINQSEFTQWGVIEENFDPVAEEIVKLFAIPVVSRSYLELMRQWFNAVQDLNPDYLKKADYNLANEIYQALGYRTPDSIFDNCG
jgi:hypothetical protein